MQGNFASLRSLRWCISPNIYNVCSGETNKECII